MGKEEVKQAINNRLIEELKANKTYSSECRKGIIETLKIIHEIIDYS